VGHAYPQKNLVVAYFECWGWRGSWHCRTLRNHAAATALNYIAYNFIKIHRTLRMSPAMAAGVTDRL